MSIQGAGIVERHKFTVEVLGLQALYARWAVLGIETKARAANAMFDWMSGVIRESKEDWVPVDTGALKDSARVHGPFFVGDNIEVVGTYGPSLSERISRGGQDWGMGEYALAVHEDWMEHGHGTWKYLITPFLSREYMAMDALRNSLGF